MHIKKRIQSFTDISIFKLFEGMSPNRRIFLNIFATYGRSPYVFVCGWLLAVGCGGVLGRRWHLPGSAYRLLADQGNWKIMNGM